MSPKAKKICLRRIKSMKLAAEKNKRLSLCVYVHPHGVEKIYSLERYNKLMANSRAWMDV